MNEHANPLTRGQAAYMIFVCLLGVAFSIYVMCFAKPIEKVEWQPAITEPSVITITPLDSPNGCYSQDFYGSV